MTSAEDLRDLLRRRAAAVDVDENFGSAVEDLDVAELQRLMWLLQRAATVMDQARIVCGRELERRRMLEHIVRPEDLRAPAD